MFMKEDDPSWEFQEREREHRKSVGALQAKNQQLTQALNKAVEALKKASTAYDACIKYDLFDTWPLDASSHLISPQEEKDSALLWSFGRDVKATLTELLPLLENK